jgi:hypothetical protein
MGVVVKAHLTAGGCVHEKTKPNKNIILLILQWYLQSTPVLLKVVVCNRGFT